MSKTASQIATDKQIEFSALANRSASEYPPLPEPGKSQDDFDEAGVPTFFLMNRMLAYNPVTGAFTWKVDRPGKWLAGSPAGSPSAGGYRRLIIFKREYKEHRVAWLLSYGTWPALDIDHRNHDRSDNRLANLRLATAAQNIWNSRHMGSKSGFRGIKLQQNTRRWNARITHQGKTMSLGYFDTPEEASAAYEAAAIRLRGDFVCLDAAVRTWRHRSDPQRDNVEDIVKRGRAR